MRKFLYIFFALFFWTCVGQKDDPEPEPETPVDLGGEEQGSRYFHRVLALEFTGSWCQYCPNMARAIQHAQSLRPGRIVEIAVHAYDNLSPSAADALISRFGVNAYPTVVMDMSGATAFSNQDQSVLTAYVDKNASALTCGLAISCKEGDVTVKVKAEKEGTYALSLALLEDGISTYQVGYGDNYVNNAVLRRFVCDEEPLGVLKAGEEVSRSFDLALSGKERVVAFVMRDGKSINVLSCKGNETIDYTYEEDD